MRSLRSTRDKQGLTTTYTYDTEGNQTSILQEGHDLTGDGCTTISCSYSFDAENLCTKQQQGRKTIQTIYERRRPISVTHYYDDIEMSRTLYRYNEQGDLIYEDRAGCIISYVVDNQGRILQKTAYPGTNDPPVICSYVYNDQGFCEEVISSQGKEVKRYDLNGHELSYESFSPSGKLLQGSYRGYNDTGNLHYLHDASRKDIIYFDYHAYGQIKLKRHLLSDNQIAYTFYDYDTRGNLKEEILPLGSHTTYTYDALCRKISSTTDGDTTTYAYAQNERLITRPLGHVTREIYTTNGYLTRVIFPDQTISLTIYDAEGRIIQETKEGITWHHHFDDLHRTVTHSSHDIAWSEEFDVRGHCICTKDPLGNITERRYDCLGRIIEEKLPCGEVTQIQYIDNRVITTLPSLEVKEEIYEGGALVVAEDYRIESDPYTRTRIIHQGDQTTTLVYNDHGKIAYDSARDTSYAYDLQGNCIAIYSTETTYQTFDKASRLIASCILDQKTTYTYDAESNLIACTMPNGITHKASYDAMHRKNAEYIEGIDGSRLMESSYIYEQGRLIASVDPLQRTHCYTYDALGHLIHERVGELESNYAYDGNGALLFASKTVPFLWYRTEQSALTRSYDANGRLTQELIYLRGALHQHTELSYTPSTKTCSINKEPFVYTYAKGKISHIKTRHLELAYTYHETGTLLSLQSPLHQTLYTYDKQGFPIQLTTYLPRGPPLEEQLTWHQGRICAYQDEPLIYTEDGALASFREERFSFSFGVRTKANDHSVQETNAFHMVVQECLQGHISALSYNAAGELLTQGEKCYTFNPWGELVAIQTPSYYWTATYDPLGRRLETTYKPSYWTKTTHFFFDPACDTEEIGIEVSGKTLWRVRGPTSTDALFTKDAHLYLIHDALRNLQGFLQEGDFHEIIAPSLYGLTTVTPIEDLISYAQALSWQDRTVDETCLVWMGARYLDPHTGRFLSPDPVGHPLLQDLYLYAHGDPVHFIDPTGEFESFAYQQRAEPSSKPLSAQERNACMDAWMGARGGFSSSFFSVGEKELEHGRICFINGIGTSFEDSVEMATFISTCARDYKVYGIHNAPNGLFADILECGFLYKGVHTPPVRMQLNEIRDFARDFRYDDKARYLCIVHSAGAAQFRNALIEVPKSIREKIIVLAIAPARIISEELCARSWNYVSKYHDFVPYLKKWFFGGEPHQHELIKLPRKEGAPWLFDHSFLSPTFQGVMDKQIQQFIQNVE